MEILLPNEQVLVVKWTRRKGSVALVASEEQHEVRVPYAFSERDVHQWVEEHEDWINETLAEHERKLKHRKQRASSQQEQAFCRPNHVALLGELLLVEFQEKPGYVVHKENRLILPESWQNQPGLVNFACEDWLTQQLIEYLDQKLPLFAEKIQVLHLVQEVKIRFYKTRWGSCTVDGRLQFNWRLIAAPKAVIDYVLVHELCHLVYLNHSRAFWALVARHCPDYQIHKAWLKTYGSQVLPFDLEVVDII